MYENIICVSVPVCMSVCSSSAWFAHEPRNQVSVFIISDYRGGKEPGIINDYRGEKEPGIPLRHLNREKIESVVSLRKRREKKSEKKSASKLAKKI